ncbi:Myosin regulatory light chain 10 [Plecturocebus cupreus]
MPPSALQCRCWPPTFLSPEARARKQLSGSVGCTPRRLLATAGKTSRLPARLQGEPCLSAVGTGEGRAVPFWTAMPWEARQGVGADPRGRGRGKASSATLQAPRRARKRAEGTASSNVFSMFDQSQIQEFKEAFTIMDQNRDGFIDKEDLRDTFAALGRINVKNEELEAMVKEAPGPINFTVFLTMFGEKLKGTDPEETILHAFKVFDTEGKGFVKADVIKEKLMTQADRFSEEEIKQMFAAFPPDVCGNLDYRNLCYIITHGEEKD